MNKRLSSAVFFLLLTFAVNGLVFAQENRLEISLRGPWILYVDHSFADWPVLIAMAPAVDHDSSNHWAHKPPLVSAGDGYYLEDPTQPNPTKVSHIYCLTFDNACAPKGSSFLRFHDYPDDVQLLHPALPGRRSDWGWAAASWQYSAPTLILPMPDSYSSDGVWHMRFADHFDETGVAYGYDEQHSIGVQLHYNSGPGEFNLIICDAQQPTLHNCTHPPKPANKSGHTRLTNSGTLRIEMKAPESDWSCDPHVRRIYPKMLELIGTPDSNPGPNKRIAYIDPAHQIQDDGSGLYDTSAVPPPADPPSSARCLDHDSQGGLNDDPPPKHGTESAMEPKQQGVPAEKQDQQSKQSNQPNIPPWVQNVEALVSQIKAAPLNSDSAKEYYLDRIEADGQDLSFPRLSQLRRIDDLVALSNAKLTAADRTRAKMNAQNPSGTISPQANLALSPVLQLLIPAITKVLDTSNDYTKSGGDCLAATMQVGP
jgi:hypothetical protein